MILAANVYKRQACSTTHACSLVKKDNSASPRLAEASVEHHASVHDRGLNGESVYIFLCLKEIHFDLS
jgi:hypothetical protein